MCIRDSSYTTLEDTTILTYPLTSLDSLNDILQKHPDVARLFLLSCFRQINILLNRSSISELNCSELYRTLNDDISTYKSLCDRYRIPARSLEHFDELNAFLGDDSPDIWLNGYYMGLNLSLIHICLVDITCHCLGTLHCLGREYLL